MKKVDLFIQTKEMRKTEMELRKFIIFAIFIWGLILGVAFGRFTAIKTVNLVNVNETGYALDFQGHIHEYTY